MRFRCRPFWSWRLRCEHAAELGSEPPLNVVDQCKGCGYDHQRQSRRSYEPTDDCNRHGTAEGIVATDTDGNGQHTGDHGHGRNPAGPRTLVTRFEQGGQAVLAEPHFLDGEV